MPKTQAPVAAAGSAKSQFPPPTKAAASDFPPVGGSGGMGSLQPIGAGVRGFGTAATIGFRQGRFDVDEDARARAMADMARLNAELDAGVPDEEEKKEEDEEVAR